MKPRIPLHRGSIEADESCAPKGSALHPHDWRNNQGRPIPKTVRPLKTVEQSHPWMWFMYAGAIVSTVAGCALMAWFRGAA
jgi:hypothetical protein